MNELISLTQSAINGELQQTVNARELHGFLESRQEFANWIKKRIDKYGFVENQDFVKLHKKMENPQGGRPAIDYHITLDMAKELVMVERNDKGKEARRYFIECEKQLRQVMSVKDSLLLGIIKADDELSRAVAINQYEVGYVKPLENKVVEQAKQIESNKPKIRYHDIVLSCPDLLTVRQIAQDYGISAQRLNSILHEKKIQYKDKSGVWLLYISYNAQGYAQTFTHTYQDNDGNYHSKLHLKWTQKGRLFIYELLKEEGILPICEQED